MAARTRHGRPYLFVAARPYRGPYPPGALSSWRPTHPRTLPDDCAASLGAPHGDGGGPSLAPALPPP